MSKRVIFGISGAVFVALAMFVFPVILLELLIAALCVIATYELLDSARLVHNRLLLILCLAVSFGIAIAHSSLMETVKARDNLIQILIYVLLIGSFLIELRFHSSMRIAQIAWGFFGAIALPYLFLSLLRIFQMQEHHGDFLVLLPLLSAWGADTCALFSGILFGRHKLAPVVSPNKTVEGAVGGVIGSTAFVMLAAFFMNYHFEDLKLPMWAAAVIGIVGAILGEIGDLSFSVIKRQVRLKDYGSIFPGHGGVLDRFDSVLFAAPFAELLFRMIW